jgi:hypothetical protein
MQAVTADTERSDYSTADVQQQQQNNTEVQYRVFCVR